MSDKSESKSGIINLEAVNCPKCGSKMPALRVPDNLHHLMWGGWTCPQCGCRMDKWGKTIESEAK